MQHKIDKKAIFIASLILSLLGTVFLIVDEIFVPLFNENPVAKLVVILVSVLSAYHSFLTFTLRATVKGEVEPVEHSLKQMGNKIDFSHELFDYEYVANAEQSFCAKNDGIIEVWIVSKKMTEMQDKDSAKIDAIINNVYTGITTHGAKYFYVLPDTENERFKFNMFCAKLKSLHKKQQGTITGGISYCFDNGATKLLDDDFQERMFLCRDEAGTPTKCEGYLFVTSKSDHCANLYKRVEPSFAFAPRGYCASVTFDTFDLTA